MDLYPIPNIEAALSKLRGATVFSSLDLESGFWQIPLRKEDREKSAFITSEGLWQFKMLPFGLKCASSNFERVMDLVLAGAKWSICLVYIDDVIIFLKIRVNI